MNSDYSDYLKRFPLMKSWFIYNASNQRYSGAVIIPSLAESANFSATLGSLSYNPPEILSRYLIVVVINNSEDASDEVIADNFKTLRILEKFSTSYPYLNLSWINAFSGELAMPAKYAGVGLARKIGLDLSLQFLNKTLDPILVSLDADTIVEPNYLETIENELSKHAVTGAVIPFAHQKCADINHQEIIDRYEIFLRTYICGLKYAGSPYAFHSVGSAMACKVSAYIKCGGMNCRKGGEDFYFLQKLKKVSDIIKISGTRVYPSPRKSDRVPFGTGKSVTSAFDKGFENITYYEPECFDILKKWLEAFTESTDATADELIMKAPLISGHLSTFLENERFPFLWERIRSQKKSRPQLAKSFHEWFDALMTMKLIHYLSRIKYPRSSSLEYVVNLFVKIGYDLEPTSSSTILDTIRKIDELN